MARATRTAANSIGGLCVLAAGTLLSIAAWPQSAPVTARAAARAAPAASAVPSRYLPAPFAGRAGRYYRLVWGIDSLNVKAVESGLIIRFAWRVLDPEKAAILSEPKVTPVLAAAQAGVELVVPNMEQIGQMRQTAPPEPGKSYWMAFSNKGRMVKRGDRVSVVIGQFRADGLVVE